MRPESFKRLLIPVSLTVMEWRLLAVVLAYLLDRRRHPGESADLLNEFTSKDIRAAEKTLYEALKRASAAANRRFREQARRPTRSNPREGNSERRIRAPGEDSRLGRRPMP
jgi:hypothetical protein